MRLLQVCHPAELLLEGFIEGEHAMIGIAPSLIRSVKMVQGL